MSSAKAIVVVVLALGAFVFAAPSQLSYNIGDEFVFNLNAYVDSKGQLQDGTRTSGSFSTMNGFVVTQCQDFSNNTYLFVMNMYNVEVNVGQSTTETMTKRISEYDEPLGYDMYFAQLPTGEITEIWYQEGDSPYFVNVKVGAINTFQTKVVPPNQTPVKAMEQDPVGNHYSYFVGAGSDSLIVTKTFTQEDFSSFADPNLQPHNVQLTATTQTVVHPSGHISASSVLQDVVIVNINPSSTAKPHKKMMQGQVSYDTTGFDMLLSSAGNLTIGEAAVYDKDRILAHFQTSKLKRYTFDTLPATYKLTTMTNWASGMVGFVGHMDEMDMTKEVMRLMAVRGQPRKEFSILNQWIKYFNNKPEDTVQLAKVMKMEIADDWLYVLKEMFLMVASLDNPAAREQAQDLLISFGLRSTNADVQASTVFTVASTHKLRITKTLFQELVSMINTNGLDNDLGRSALLALGSAVGKADDEAVIALAKEYFAGLLNDKQHRALIIDAIGNAGRNGISFNKFLESFGGVMLKSELGLKFRLVKALRKFPSIKVVPWLLEQARIQTDKDLLRAISKAARAHLANLPSRHSTEYQRGLHAPKKGAVVLADSEFPFNKSYTNTWTFGGSSINAVFDLDLFVGTNFDCNQQYFNYEGLAEADATINFYSETKSVFQAEALYGKADGNSVGNELYLEVWGDVIYQNQIPVVDCNLHTYPLYQKSTGFDYTYTIWVSVIPVTFEASVGLSLDAQWGWQICDSTLSALVEIIPDGAIIIAGNAEIDLLIIKAGITLSAQFEAEPTPQGYIQGSQCSLGLDVALTLMPMDAEFLGYYAWDDCKYWIFDCHWGEHNQQTFWSWDQPGSTQTILDQNWKIAQ